MDDKAINEHYGVSGILNSILDGLESSGKDLHRLELNDLAPIDEFHTRGKESTIEIANLAQKLRSFLFSNALPPPPNKDLCSFLLIH